MNLAVLCGGFWTFIFLLSVSVPWKKPQKSSHSTLSPDPIPSLAMLHTEKQAFQCAALQSWELRPGIKGTCIVEPYNTSRLPIILLQFWANRVKVVTFICARGHAHSRCAWAENMAFLYKHNGKTSTITINCESTIPAVKLLVLIQRQCRYGVCGMCSREL